MTQSEHLGMQIHTGNDQAVVRYVGYKSGLASVYMSTEKGR
jgi:hypothetical protein